MFRRVKFGGISGTGLKGTVDISADAMQKTFGEPDRYGGEPESSYNWEFRSASNQYAVYNIYTHDDGKTMKLGHNDIGEPTLTFLDWLHAEVQ